jgi:hypothetical protein
MSHCPTGRQWAKSTDASDLATGRDDLHVLMYELWPRSMSGPCNHQTQDAKVTVGAVADLAL